MKKEIPTWDELPTLLGNEKFAAWQSLCAAVDAAYDMETTWGAGGKAWDCEYKYRRGGKTLCALYARENCFGVLIIFGKDERAKFEAVRGEFSETTQAVYYSATTYHDGKWMMFEPDNTALLGDIMKLLAIKRKPNRK